jgi:hypothetical protein
MTKGELRKLAIKQLNKKSVKSIKKQVCDQFVDKKQKKDCAIGFDKGFIKTFIASHQNRM